MGELRVFPLLYMFFLLDTCGNWGNTNPPGEGGIVPWVFCPLCEFGAPVPALCPDLPVNADVCVSVSVCVCV